MASNESHPADWTQALRAGWRNLRARLPGLRLGARTEDGDAGSEASQSERIGRVGRVSLAVAIVVIVIYPLSAWFYSTIDDNPQFGPSGNAANPHESQTIAAISALINREVNTHGWAASAPFFEPPALLDDMPKYQEGIVAALANVTESLRDHAGAPNSDLTGAVELLQYPPNVWYWNPRQSLWPKAPSDEQYRHAIADLAKYNDSLASGDAQFDRSAEVLQMILQRIGEDLDSSSATIEFHIDRATRPRIHERTDEIFYETKGRLYGYYIALKGMQIDYQDEITARHLTATWASMMATLRAAIGMRPSMVLDGSPDSDFVPCTLCGEGFYVLRVRSEIEDIAKTLG